MCGRRNVLVFTDSLEGVRASHLSGFFVGWGRARPTPERHLEILRASTHVVLARESETRVVGFINAISDGVLAAYIPLLEVLPDWQRRGIGSELVRRIVRRLDEMYMIDVVCDPDVAPFYERLGFGRVIGMARRNYGVLTTTRAGIGREEDGGACAE